MEIVRDLLVLFTTTVVFLMNMEFRYTFKKVAIIFTGFGIISFTIYCFLLNRGYEKEIISLLCFSLPSLFVCLWVSKYRKARFVFTFALVDIIAVMIIILGKILALLFDNNAIISLFIIIVLLIIYIVLAYKFRLTYLEILNSVETGWTTMALAAVIIYIFTFVIIAYPTPIANRREYLPTLFGYVFLVVVILKVIYDAAKNNIAIYIEKYEKENQEIKIKLNEAYYALAYKDKLSDLKNRNAFEEYLNTLENVNDKNIVCLSLDLDNLKMVNDHIGHYAGDQLISKMGYLLQKCFAIDSIFRIGGDEFIVIFEANDTLKIQACLKKMGNEAKSLENELNIPFKYSKGLALGKSQEIRKVVKRADKNMYREKNSHRNQEHYNKKI